MTAVIECPEAYELGFECGEECAGADVGEYDEAPKNIGRVESEKFVPPILEAETRGIGPGIAGPS